MALKTTHKNLGRGLSALIPDSDMAFLSQIARGESIVPDSPKLAGTSSIKSSSKKSISNKVSENKRESPQMSSAAAKSTDSKSGKTILNARTTGRQSNSTAKSGKEALPINDRGVESLKTVNLADELNGDESSKELGIDSVLLNAIEANPYQPRRTFSAQELQDLADSVREHGLLQPIILRPLPMQANGAERSESNIKYQLVAGERRWRAAQAAGLEQIPAIVREVSDQQALELALIENVQRHDISALDAAVAYRRLSQEFSLSQEQVAQRVGKSRSSVANTIRLLDLPPDAQKALEDGVLSEGHGRAILLAPTDGARRAVLRRILRDKLSVRDSEELARQISNENQESATDDDAAPLKIRLSPEARRIEEGLQKHLGTRVKLKLRRQGGQILIHYFSNEELDRVLKLIIK